MGKLFYIWHWKGFAFTQQMTDFNHKVRISGWKFSIQLLFEMSYYGCSIPSAITFQMFRNSFNLGRRCSRGPKYLWLTLTTLWWIYKPQYNIYSNVFIWCNVRDIKKPQKFRYIFYISKKAKLMLIRAMAKNKILKIFTQRSDSDSSFNWNSDFLNLETTNINKV